MPIACSAGFHHRPIFHGTACKRHQLGRAIGAQRAAYKHEESVVKVGVLSEEEGEEPRPCFDRMNSWRSGSGLCYANAWSLWYRSPFTSLQTQKELILLSCWLLEEPQLRVASGGGVVVVGAGGLLAAGTQPDHILWFLTFQVVFITLTSVHLSSQFKIN